jgi:hypothetical protein
MRNDTLPIEFSALNGKVNYIQRVTAGEWSSSCPECGGIPHQNGEFPDRFRMWTQATGKNRVMGWCRHCSYIWFPDSDRPMKPHEFEQWRKDAEIAEKRRKAEAEKALSLLRSEKIWDFYHAKLNDWSLEVLQSWGIRKDWADYWKLGFFPDYKCYGKEDPYFTPAITIPIWQHDFKMSNIKVRTLNPKSDDDRYRSLYKTGASMPFVALPGLKCDTVLVVEGEKKAMVTAQWSGDKFQVVGVPTKTPSAESLKMLDRYNKVVVCLDPDAKVGDNSPLKRLVSLLGPDRVLNVDLPGKIDDLIVQNGLNIHNALKYAKKLEV